MVEEFNPNNSYFLDKSTIIYGESGTGKSFIVRDIMSTLKPYIDQVLVFSPTDQQNHTYDDGLVPRAFIHYDIQPHVLDAMWERQEALAAVYRRSNDLQVLKSLFNKVADGTYKDLVRAINEKLSIYSNEILSENSSGSKDKIKGLTDKCNELKCLVYKKCINNNRGELERMHLNEEERFSLKNCNINPRLLLIFDDCTDILAKLKTYPIIQKLFYQGRHSFITIIIACHTDKSLANEVRAQSFVNIFTYPDTFRAFIERKKPPANVKKEAHKICAEVFTPMKPHQKLVYLRTNSTYYKYTACEHEDFEFCSGVVRDYGRKLEADGCLMPHNNRFIRNFM